MKKRLLASLLVLCMVLALGLTACSGGTNATTTTTAGDGATTTTAAEGGEETTAAEGEAEQRPLRPVPRPLPPGKTFPGKRTPPR